MLHSQNFCCAKLLDAELLGNVQAYNLVQQYHIIISNLCFRVVLAILV